MTGVVVEVGPVTVRGPNPADAEWVSAGIDGIDDELTLIDECPVAVTDVWRTLMQDAAGGSAETIVLVCPTWWASSRVDCVRDAAGAVATDVVVLRRAEVLRDCSADRLTTVVEIAPEFVVLSSPEGDVQVAARGDADAVFAKIPMSMAVVVDAAEGVAGALPLAAAIADRLRANGVTVTIADRDSVRRSAAPLPSQDEEPSPEARPSTNRGRRATAVLAGTLLSAAVLCGGFAARHDIDGSAANLPMTLLVEGRVGVMVPAQWVVQRVTSGPGSARVQVVSPTDADIAVHVTQSSLPPHQSHDQVAESLRTALKQQPDGVFVEFNPSDRRADQPVVTYREVRADHHIAWVILADGSLRIAIGCQSAPGHEEAVREACDQAIRSAHAVF
jgi:type VII secretion-associated protein (TIGR03931 family)